MSDVPSRSLDGIHVLIALVPHGGMRSAPVLAPGFDRYLPKPADREELRAAARALLRR